MLNGCVIWDELPYGSYRSDSQGSKGIEHKRDIRWHPDSNVDVVRTSLNNLGHTRGILIRLFQNGHTMKLYVAKVPVADGRSQVAARDQQSLKSIILSVTWVTESKTDLQSGGFRSGGFCHVSIILISLKRKMKENERKWKGNERKWKENDRKWKENERKKWQKLRVTKVFKETPIRYYLISQICMATLRTNDWCKHTLQLKDFAPSVMVQKLAVRHTAVEEIGLPFGLECYE